MPKFGYSGGFLNLRVVPALAIEAHVTALRTYLTLVMLTGASRPRLETSRAVVDLHGASRGIQHQTRATLRTSRQQKPENQ